MRALTYLLSAFFAAWAGFAAASDMFQDCERCPQMIGIPAGAFTMGAAEGEHWADEREEYPRHDVTIGAFAMGVTEVSTAQWTACLTDGGCGGYRPDGFEEWEASRPVTFISLDDAQLYIDWLNGQVEGEPYRLPSEAEWEYAARGGTIGTFWTGRGVSAEHANFDGRRAYGSALPSRYRRELVPVGSLPANPFGLREILGNVWEWCQDCWNVGYEGAPTDGSAWMYGDCEEAVLRGGAYNSRAKDLRSANRFYLPRDQRNFKIGFRVARDLPLN